jgi:hypothetical protein
MTLQLELPAGLEERLRQESKLRGQPIEAVALRLLEEKLPPSEEEIVQRIQQAKTLEEMFAAAAAIPDADDGYDLLKALDENRKGVRQLEDRRAAAIAMLVRWGEEDATLLPEQEASNEDVLRALDADRPSYRKLFANELQDDDK